MAPQGGGAVDVTGRIELGLERAPGGGDRRGVGGAAGQRGLGAASTQGCGPDTEEYDAGFSDCAALDTGAGSHASQREVAMPPRQLLEGRAPARRPRHDHLDEELARVQRSGVDPAEEVFGPDLAPAAPA